jgi:hypothetical protein
VAYTPDWEPLSDALKRVMAMGAGENDAKTDLCSAIADRKINVRVKVSASECGMPRRFFSGANVDVPTPLTPGDLDWEQSRPFAKWRIGPRPPEHYTWIGSWEDRAIDLVEVSTVDVIEILPAGPEGKTSAATSKQENEAIKALTSYLKSKPQLTRAEALVWCKDSGFNLTGRGFQSRVWPKARTQAGLQPLAPSGRKKSMR